MEFTLTKGQLNRIADICEDLGKGNIIAALAAPAVSDSIDLSLLVFGLFAGLTLLYFAISIESVKGKL